VSPGVVTPGADAPRVRVPAGSALCGVASPVSRRLSISARWIGGLTPVWTYRQGSGELLHDGVVVATGYSGNGECMNCAARQDVPNHGPIPRGKYVIGERHDTEAHGPVVMRLTPDPGNEMYGRSGFLCHGDNSTHTASEGCIVLPRPIRIAMAASADRTLEVIA
jgi:hypothetical protein